MKVFVTGATGFVGSAVVRDLLAAGHEVTGLARSDEAAARVAAAGAGVHRGSLADPGSLRAGAAEADGVIHTAYIHDFSPTGDPVAAARTDARAIEALGSALAGSGRSLVVATGAALLGPGKPATEDDDLPGDPLHPRLSEQTALPLAGQDVRVSVVRLPPSVHGEGDYAFVPFMIGIARATGRAAYVGDGANRWAAVHRVDAARLFRLGLESAQAGSRLHAVGDEGVPFREIARVISLHLQIPLVSVTADEAPGQFGGLAHFAAADLPATAALTRERFGWRPVQPGLIADLDTGHYFAVA
jgi:nucleoside-diphosphate-sugar epimerase